MPPSGLARSGALLAHTCRPDGVFSNSDRYVVLDGNRVGWADLADTTLEAQHDAGEPKPEPYPSGWWFICGAFGPPSVPLLASLVWHLVWRAGRPEVAWAYRV